jgi:hypothetical protein
MRRHIALRRWPPRRQSLSIELFHLTFQGESDIAFIEQEGLRPGPDGWDFWGGMGNWAAETIGDVVWLIDDPTFKQWEGILEPDLSSPLWRVVCAIPAQDPKLIRFGNLFRNINRFMDSVWVYAGVVRPDLIKDIEFLGVNQSNWNWGEGVREE